VHVSLIVDGYFNSRAEDWGMPPRGRKRMGRIFTLPGITLVSEKFAHRILDWKVLDIYNGSDHEYISFSAEGRRAQHVGNQIRTSHRLHVNRLNKTYLIREIDRIQIESKESDSVESLARSTMCSIKRACDAAMPKSGNPHRRGAEVYWWTDEINALRETSLRYRN